MKLKNVSIVMTSSLIPSHPDPSITLETLASVRHHFPDQMIYLLFDGVRPEQIDQVPRFVKYMHNLIEKLTQDETQRGKITFVPFGKFTHQAGMMRKILEVVKTPLILFMEHDTPFLDRPIAWQECIDLIDTGNVNLVRFYHEESIPEEHRYLMAEKIQQNEAAYVKTLQFSARPHLTTKRFYEELLAHFSPEAQCFIEDKAHSICQSEPWGIWKMTIYEPDPEVMKRTTHLDGRAGSPKFDESQVF